WWLGVCPPSGSSGGGRGEPILENLALALRRLAEPPRRDTSGPTERAHEVREVAAPGLQRDVGDRAGVVREQARGVAQPGSDQVLMRRHAEDVGEDPQEVKRADPDLSRHAVEVDRLVR